MPLDLSLLLKILSALTLLQMMVLLHSIILPVKRVISLLLSSLPKYSAYRQQELYIACQNGHLSVASLLIDKDADLVHVARNDGYTPLHARSLHEWPRSYCEVSH